MGQNTVAQPAAGAGAKVMGAVEDGQQTEFIIADITTDDAYLTMPLDEAASLRTWR